MVPPALYIGTLKASVRLNGPRERTASQNVNLSSELRMSDAEVKAVNLQRYQREMNVKNVG